MFWDHEYLFSGAESYNHIFWLLLGYGYAVVLVYMIGKAGIATVFLFDYFWSSEMFPTTLRSSLVGLCSLFARIGSILSPIIADMVRLIKGHWILQLWSCNVIEEDFTVQVVSWYVAVQRSWDSVWSRSWGFHLWYNHVCRWSFNYILTWNQPADNARNHSRGQCIHDRKVSFGAAYQIKKILWCNNTPDMTPDSCAMTFAIFSSSLYLNGNCINNNLNFRAVNNAMQPQNSESEQLAILNHWKCSTNNLIFSVVCVHLIFMWESLPIYKL